MSTVLLLDAECDVCGYTTHNLALGANPEFLRGDPDGWLSVVSACPSCRVLVDVTVTRSEITAAASDPDLFCPDCGTALPDPNAAYPDLTMTRIAAREQTEIENQRCPRCGEHELTVRIVGTV